MEDQERGLRMYVMKYEHRDFENEILTYLNVQNGNRMYVTYRGFVASFSPHYLIKKRTLI